MTLPAPALEHVADLTVFVATPIEAGQVTGLNSRGRRRIIPITGGKVTGQLNGAVLPGGADFQIVVSDTCADLDARYLLQLDNGEHVFVQNRALRRGAGQQRRFGEHLIQVFKNGQRLGNTHPAVAVIDQQR